MRTAIRAFRSQGRRDIAVVGAEQFNKALTEIDGILDQLQDTRDEELALIRTALSFGAISKAGLAIGSASAAKVKIVNTTYFLHDGLISAKTTAEVAFTATEHDLADGDEAVYAVTLAADGTPHLTMGTSATGAGNADPPSLSDLPEDEALIGYVRVLTVGAVFDASTTDLSAGTVTDTYYDAAMVPFDAVLSPYTRFGTDLAAVQNVMQNRTLAPPGLAIGTDATKVLIANTVVFSLGGILYSKTTAEVAFTATAHDIAADALTVQEAVYLLSIVANGTVTITKGTVAAGAGSAAIPAVPASQVPIGYVRVAVAAGAVDFDASSDDLDDAHLTVTYVDLSFIAPTLTCLSADVQAEFNKVLDTLGNQALSAAGVAIGSVSAATVKTAATVVYVRDGVFASKAAFVVAFTPDKHDIEADASTAQEAVYLLTLNEQGAPTLTKGTVASGAGNAVSPATPDGHIVLGAVRIEVAAGATDFDAGTDLLSAAHITDTYYDAAHVPPAAVSSFLQAQPLEF